MRKEKIDELHNYIEELKVKRCELLDAQGKFLTSERYLIELNNGRTFVREKLVKNGKDGSAVIILPVTCEGNILLVVQPRVFTRNGVGVELPAGYVDEGETHEDAAYRELLEETGYVSDDLRFLGAFYQDQGCSAAFNKAFLAERCSRVSEQSLDGDEFIRYFECSVDEMLELVDMGYVSDCQSQLVIERSRQYLKK